MKRAIGFEYESCLKVTVGMAIKKVGGTKIVQLEALRIDYSFLTQRDNGVPS